MQADRQAFGSTREYLGAVVESVKRWGYFKGFEGHTEYSIKGSMCSLERKISSAKAWRSFCFITYSCITSLTTTWPLKPLWHYSLRNELGWVLSPCFQSSRDTFLSSCLGPCGRFPMFLPRMWKHSLLLQTALLTAERGRGHVWRKGVGQWSLSGHWGSFLISQGN